MAKVLYISPTKIGIQDNGNKVKCMVRVNFNGLTDLNMKDSIHLVKNVELASLRTKVEIIIKVIG